MAPAANDMRALPAVVFAVLWSALPLPEVRERAVVAAGLMLRLARVRAVQTVQSAEDQAGGALPRPDSRRLSVASQWRSPN